MSPTDEFNYLKTNSEYLRTEKRRLEKKVQFLEARVQDLEHGKFMLHEQLRHDLQLSDSGEMEISSLRQQLNALMLLKDELYSENKALEGRLETLQQSQVEDSKQAACVICLDNLANLVCIPCKHLALCIYCEQDVTTCPICRTTVEDKMQIFTP